MSIKRLVLLSSAVVLMGLSIGIEGVSAYYLVNKDISEFSTEIHYMDGEFKDYDDWRYIVYKAYGDGEVSPTEYVNLLRFTEDGIEKGLTIYEEWVEAGRANGLLNTDLTPEKFVAQQTPESSSLTYQEFLEQRKSRKQYSLSDITPDLYVKSLPKDAQGLSKYDEWANAQPVGKSVTPMDFVVALSKDRDLKDEVYGNPELSEEERQKLLKDRGALDLDMSKYVQHYLDTKGIAPNNNTVGVTEEVPSIDLLSTTQLPEEVTSAPIIETTVSTPIIETTVAPIIETTVAQPIIETTVAPSISEETSNNYQPINVETTSNSAIDEVIPYKTYERLNSSLLPTERKVIQRGQNGIKRGDEVIVNVLDELVEVGSIQVSSNPSLVLKEGEPWPINSGDAQQTTTVNNGPSLASAGDSSVMMSGVLVLLGGIYLTIKGRLRQLIN